MFYLTRRCEFSAAHNYHNPELSPEENRRLFGRCNNPNGHGHNYVLEVTVRGELDPRAGWVMDIGELKRLIEREILASFDHCYLNKEIEELRTLIPTTENLALVIWRRLQPVLAGAELHRVRVRETDDLFVDYYGEP
jgi:6-pyruvoyltetrahydropterin/6-carboxytetrahydropterin synthase